VTAIITGGAKGIGAACCKAFAKDGFSVAIIYKSSREKAEALCSEIKENGGRAIAVKCDCSDENEVNNMLAEVEKKLGSVDVLVNNAGISLIKLFTDTTVDDWDNVFNNNLKSAFLCSRAVTRGMINNGGGAIVNVSSMWGISGGSCEVAYSASKAGMIGLTKSLAKELSLSNIRVNCICPGVIDTDMNASLGKETLEQLKEEIPLGRLGSPDEVAHAVLFLAKATYVTGAVLTCDGGIN